MNLRTSLLGILALVACSRSADDAGIVLNVDTDVTSDRASIDQVNVTVDGRRQEWKLKQPLPGSLGITTSPGSKTVTVQGFASGSLRGEWSDTIVATQGEVIVRDVHLSHVGARLDAGTRDGSGDVATTDLRDVARDGADVAPRRDSASVDGGTGVDTARVPAVDAIGSVRDTDDTRVDARDAAALDGPGPDAGAYDGPSAIVTGAYAVSSDFDLRALAATPGSIRDVLGLVHGLVADPGTAILDFADQAGVPALGTLRSVLPDALETGLSGWINAYIKTPVAGRSPYEQLVELDNLVQTLILEWNLASSLALPLDRPGTHAPVSLLFMSAVHVPLEGTVGVTSGIDVVTTLTWPSGSGGPALVTVSDHFMGFPFGRYALPALNAILLAQYGKPNMAAYLADYVGCEGMANSVSSQCVSVLCVGHKSDLLAICEGGLAAAASRIEEQILALDFKALRFHSGRASADGVTLSRPQDATSWRNGVWDVTVDLGNGPEVAKATFTAAAQATSP